MGYHRTRSDLRALGNGYLPAATPPATTGQTIWLAIPWNDTSRADRLKAHGWIEQPSSLTEAYVASLTETGTHLYNHWQELAADGSLESVLDPDTGGGVPAFCTAAVSDEPV